MESDVVVFPMPPFGDITAIVFILFPPVIFFLLSSAVLTAHARSELIHLFPDFIKHFDDCDACCQCGRCDDDACCSHAITSPIKYSLCSQVQQYDSSSLSSGFLQPEHCPIPLMTGSLNPHPAYCFAMVQDFNAFLVFFSCSLIKSHLVLT